MVVFTASIAALQVLAGLGGIAAISRRATSPSQSAIAASRASAARARAAKPAPSSDAASQSIVTSISAFVSKARNLPFAAAVPSVFLDDAAFEAQLRAGADGDAPKLTEAQATSAAAIRVGFLSAIGYVNGGYDPRSAAASATRTSHVLGFYDPKAHRLFVRGQPKSPGARVTLAHELTHALQDQSFGLDRPELESRDDQSSFGLRALAEGDARRVEKLYLATLSPAEQAEAERSSTADAPALAAGTDPATQGLALELLQEAPYIFGEELVRALLSAGGQPILDAAFADPPRSSEQVLHADKLLTRDGGRAVGTPSAQGATIDDGAFGELALAAMLGGAIGFDAARHAIAGWGGDHYAAWKSGANVCVRVAVRMDDPRLNQKVATAFTAFAAWHGNATANTGGTPGVTTCGASAHPSHLLDH